MLSLLSLNILLSYLMGEILSSYTAEDYPFRVLNHSDKHGYNELADRATEISISCSDHVSRYIGEMG